MSGPSEPVDGAATVRDRPPEHRVRHCYCKYPVIALAMAGILIALGVAAGSPNWPRDTIKAVSRKDPGGAVLAFTQELDGTASSWMNEKERGMGRPDLAFVINPVVNFAPLLGADVSSALATYRRAASSQQTTWAANYDAALACITPQGGDGSAMPASTSASGCGSGAGEMSTVPSPDYSKIGTLKGDFGPVPTLVQADLSLARGGYLDQYLAGNDPGHSLHLVTIWLYDEPAMMNAAVANGLTDDQWGMVKERGYSVGPWYLIIPALAHVKLPGGVNGGPFIVWNLLIALFFMFAIPFLPGLRSLPERLKLYRFMYRYPSDAERTQWPHVGEPTSEGRGA